MTTNEEWIIGHTPVKEEFPTFGMLFQRREGGGGGAGGKGRLGSQRAVKTVQSLYQIWAIKLTYTVRFL